MANGAASALPNKPEELAFAQNMVVTLEAALLKAVNSEEYRIGSRSVRHQRLEHLNSQLRYWRLEVARLTPGGVAPIKTRFAVPGHGS